MEDRKQRAALWAALFVLGVGCSGQAADSGELLIIATCDTVECPEADGYDSYTGALSSSTTCQWDCTEWAGLHRRVTVTYVKDSPDSCYFEANLTTELCTND